MANYKVIYRQDLSSGGKLWQTGCPLYLHAIQVSRNTETSACYLQLKFQNISDAVVESFDMEITAICADNSVERLERTLLDADVQPHRVFVPEAIPLSGSQVIGASVLVLKTTSGGKTWCYPHEEPAAVPSLSPDLSPEALAERSLELTERGKNPEDYRQAAIQRDDWWRCSCGAHNVGDGTCVRYSCGLPKAEVFALQDEAKLQEQIIERRKKARKSKRIKLIIIGVVVAIAITCIPIGVFAYHSAVQASDYQQAYSLQTEKEYLEAFELFSSLGEFKDSDERARICALSYANQLITDNDPEGAKEWLVDYLGGEDQFISYAQKEARRCLDEGYIPAAAIWYTALGDTEKADAAKYQYISESVGKIDKDKFRSSKLLNEWMEELAAKDYKDVPKLLKRAKKWLED